MNTNGPRIISMCLVFVSAVVASGEIQSDAAKVISQLGGKVSLSKASADGAVIGVNFRGASVDEHALTVLERLPAMKTLDLTGARISDGSLRHVSRLDRLESLTLIGTRVGDDGMRHLAGLSRLRHLDLTGTDVGDAGIAQLAKLKSLHTLRLAGTLLTDAGMTHLRALKNLEVLDLYGTRITGKGVLQLDGLRQLRELDVYGYPENSSEEPTREEALCELARKNALPNIERLHFRVELVTDFQSLANCPKLQSLCLSVQHESDFQTLSNLKELRSLELFGPGFLREWPDRTWAHLAGLKNLESLSLDRETATERGLAYISRLTGLRNLLLRQTGVNGERLRLLAPLRSLRSLDLSFNQLRDKDLAKLPELISLETLYLSDNDLGPNGLEVLPRLDSLAILDLSRCTFPESQLRSLRKFPKLRDLSLNGAFTDASHTGWFRDEAVKHLKELKNLHALDVRGTGITEEGIRTLRRDLPGLETVRYEKTYHPKPAPPANEIGAEAHELDAILVQAMVPTSTNAPNTIETRGLITQMYLGPRSLQGQTFVACYPFGHPHGFQTTTLGSGRLATDELVLTYLSRDSDGILRMNCLGGDRFGFTWPAWLVQAPVGYLGSPKPDYHRQRELAEFLRATSQKSPHERVALLQQQVIRGNDVEASAAAQLLLAGPIEKAIDAHLLRLLEDERVPLSRRILIDHAFWLGWPERAWVQSAERMSLLRSWAGALKSREDADRLARDLRGFGDVTSESWMSHPEPKKRALALIEAVTAVQGNTKASVEAKVDAVLALGAWSTAAARSECFQTLSRLAKDSPHELVRSWAISQLSSFSPFTSDEAVQVRKLLKATVDERSRKRLEEALAAPRKP